jgi:hypothetical protein
MIISQIDDMNEKIPDAEIQRTICAMNRGRATLISQDTSILMN